jgi:small-conductance mechanosensitive channel
MKEILRFNIFILTAFLTISMFAQTDSVVVNEDSINLALMKEYQAKMAAIELQKKEDSTNRYNLEQEIEGLKTTDNLKKEELQNQLDQISAREKARLKEKKSRIDSLKTNTKGFPVVGPMQDTVFQLYAKSGSLTARERSSIISKKIEALYDDDFFNKDALQIIPAENVVEIIYDDMIIMGVSESDALWNDTTQMGLATIYTAEIADSITQAKFENSTKKVLIRTGLVLLIILVVWLIFWLVGRGFTRLLAFFESRKGDWLKGFKYGDYTFVNEEQQYSIVMFFFKMLKWFVYIIIFYFTLPVLFSVFPFTRSWADKLFHLVWSPFNTTLQAVWDYLPNLISIIVIVVIMRYFIKFVKYVFAEIEAEKLKLTGFHADWAMPTYSIVRFLLLAFMFVLIFPYLPGSDSNIFKGVSVFIGILFSLGSSSAIANMVAGLVITYMRPFKIGDRIKIGEISGDVIEKTLLVTRLKTIKNEEITIPNATILNGNTINYSSYSQTEGIIVHTTVTIGYDVPWREMHEALIDAALKTELISKNPAPFVLQTSLEDFYVSYQINAFTNEVNRQAVVYSQLHQNIQDICNERGIEILSPHYRAQRDGNTTTIPPNYLPKDYKAPGFNINSKSPE